MSQSAILAAFDAADDVLRAEDRSELSANLEQARNQIRRKIEAYARERGQVRVVRTVTVLEGGTYVEGSDQIITGGTFAGPVINRVAAETIENSFNTVANSGASDELKAALTTLYDEFAALTHELEERGAQPEKIEDAARLLDTFAQQAVEKRPLREVLVASGKGLVDAAKAVSERVTPIAGAVGAILKLLGVAAVL
jgi:hypothetical protein